MFPRTFLAVGCALLGAAVSSGAEEPPQLVDNCRFAQHDAAGLPAVWQVWRPGHEAAACEVKVTGEGLRVGASGDRPFAVGGVSQQVGGISPGTAYRVMAVCKLRDIAAPYRAVMVRLTWSGQGKPLHPAGYLVRGPIVEGDVARFDDVLLAPQGADGAEVALEVKWPAGGSVLWQSVTLVPAEPPPPRKVKIGTVYLRPRNSTPEKNLELFCQQVEAAGELGLDIVCLGEAITTVGTSKRAYEVAEPIPGPSTERLGQAARKHRMWVVAGLTERDGSTLYNTAVLIDRQGQLAGKYRKVHLPREEWKQGITPGHEYPVFTTDFGKVAIQICYDWFFPESHAIFAMRGAEVVFAPTWGNTLPDKDGKVDGESTFRVRARDNGIFLVPSVYDGNSMVIDPMGRILVSNEGREGVFWCEVDLSLREQLYWVGYWRSIGPRDRMPETYEQLLRDPEGPTY